MKKVIFAILISGFAFVTVAKAQTLQEGINHLYADRFQLAMEVFQKLLTINPNNTEATYWLGQTYFDMDDNAAARKIYEKALMASANSPLLLVGKGHAELLDKKTGEARQLFEAALTMTRTKKGDDPVILNAIGRANVDAKMGDVKYAIDKLEAAVQKDPKNPEIFLNLGNAYRKYKPGEAGDAFKNYQIALSLNPNFAYVYVRIAKIFQTQKNRELILENLLEAIARDPKFTLAYKELFDYYYWDDPNFTEAEKYLNKYIESKLPVKDIQDDYLYAQLCYLKKDYTCAIEKSQNVIKADGSRTKPKVYKLLAYASVEKGDTLNARKYVDEYFAREKPEDFVSLDYVLKANIYSGIPGNFDEVVKAYLEAANADTTVNGKVFWLKKGAELMKSKGNRFKEAEFREMVFKIKPSPSNLDIFDWGLSLYFGNFLVRADSVFTFYIAKYPEEPFGLQMAFDIKRLMDTAMEKGLAVPLGEIYMKVLEKDTVKNKSRILSVAGYLATYYANILKDKEKAIVYLTRMLQLDPSNEAIKANLDILMKPPKQSTNPSKGASGKPTGKNNKAGYRTVTKSSLVKK